MEEVGEGGLAGTPAAKSAAGAGAAAEADAGADEGALRSEGKSSDLAPTDAGPNE